MQGKYFIFLPRKRGTRLARVAHSEVVVLFTDMYLGWSEIEVCYQER